MSGLAPDNIRLDQGPEPSRAPGIDVALDDVSVEPALSVQVNTDGSVTIDLGSAKGKNKADTKFNDNLADFIDNDSLQGIVEDLLRGIEDDIESRKEWVDDRATGLEMLALKMEKPGASSDGSAPVEGQSRVRHTMLLDAVLRFQANASGELLPAEGPVKVANDDDPDPYSPAEMQAKAAIGHNGGPALDQPDGDDLADVLEQDFNHYLTTTAKEYYPDTRRMLFLTGLGGSGFKKIYRDPIRRRPVSESVDAVDLIVSSSATDLQSADRITHRVMMRPSVMKRMQKRGAYRDVPLQTPTAPQKNEAERMAQDIAGITTENRRPEDEPHQVYETQCLLDLPGFEDEDEDGIPLPYRVTIEVTSRQCLAVYRDWKEDDELKLRQQLYVRYPFVDAIGFYGLGLAQIMSNPTMAATALWRLCIDNGIFANFPGFLIAEETGRQNSNLVRVPPGSGAPIKTNGQDIRAVVANLPYRDTGAGTLQLMEQVIASGEKIGGTAEIQVGEGRQDAPVGTTIALIEQSMKVMDAVHKGLHTAQKEEFELLRDLFREHPEDFWRFNPKPATQWTEEKLIKALNDSNIVPAADPNTASHMQRIMRAQAIFTMAQTAPQLFDLRAVAEYVLKTIGAQNSDQLLAPANAAPPPDPKAQADMLNAQASQTKAQASLMDAGTKAKTAQADIAAKAQESQNDLKIQEMESSDVRFKARADAISQAGAQQHDASMEAAKLRAEHGHEQQIQANQHAHDLRGKILDHALNPPQSPPQGPLQ